METPIETLERRSPPSPPRIDSHSKSDDEQDASSPSVADAILEIEGEIVEDSSPLVKEKATAALETTPAVLTDDLRDKIVRQVEFYFSDENLPNDKFMLNHVRKDKQGFVFIGVITSFKKN